MRYLQQCIYMVLFIVSLLPQQLLASTRVEYIDISEDKKLLALYYEENILRLYSLEDGSLLQESTPIHNDDEYDDDMVFMTNDKILIIFSGSYNYLWDIKTKKMHKVKKDRELLMRLYAKVHEKKSNQIMHETWREKYRKITIIDNATKKEKAILEFKKELNISDIGDISFSKDGKYAALCVEFKEGPMKVMLLDTNTYAIKRFITPMSKAVRRTLFLGNHKLLIESGYPVEVWDIDQDKPLFTFTKEGGNHLYTSMQEIAKKEFLPYQIDARINGLDVNPKTGNIIATGTGYPLGSIELNQKGELSQVFQNPYSTGYDARYSPDGRYAAFAFHGEHLLIFDVEGKKLDKEYDLGGVPNGTRIVKFSKDSRYLAAGSDGNELSIIDIKDKNITDTIKFSSGIFALQWIDNETILVGTLLELYEVDLKTKKRRTILESPTIALDGYFENDKLMLLTVGRDEDKTLILDSNYTKIKTFDIPSVGRISFSKDGKNIIAISDSYTAIYKLDGTKKVCEGEDQLWAMAYDKNRGLIYTGGDEGRVNVYDHNCTLLNEKK